jgi:hypothetical protein
LPWSWRARRHDDVAGRVGTCVATLWLIAATVFTMSLGRHHSIADATAMAPAVSLGGWLGGFAGPSGLQPWDVLLWVVIAPLAAVGAWTIEGVVERHAAKAAPGGRAASRKAGRMVGIWRVAVLTLLVSNVPSAVGSSVAAREQEEPPGMSAVGSFAAHGEPVTATTAAKSIVVAEGSCATIHLAPPQRRSPDS